MTGTSWEEYAGSTTPALKPVGSIAPSSRPFRLARVPLARDKISCRHMFLPCSVGPHNRHGGLRQHDILMVHYEDLPDGDKDVISKAIEEFQNKCSLSYTKTCDNTIVQNIHYQEFCCMGRQMQKRLKTGISSWKL